METKIFEIISQVQSDARALHTDPYREPDESIPYQPILFL
jgi:hypothetical protein